MAHAMFQSFQSFLAYLLALLVVYACLRVFRSVNPRP